jgi:multimeric flavodoxin WrbA
MNITVINGSPRKGWNTDVLLHKAVEGAKSVGAKVELLNLYDLEFKGCRSCLACKVKDGKSLGHCVVDDGLQPVLEKIDKSDGLILGSPVYFGDVTAEMRALLERLIFQYTNFDGGKSFFTGKLKTAFIYTMNAPEGYFDALYEKYADMLGWYFEYVGTVAAAETMQVQDYSRYHLGMFDAQQRYERRENVFPQDCDKACELGKKMAQM